MNKKILSLSILAVIILGGIIPQIATANQNQVSASSSIFDSFRFLKFNTTLYTFINQTDLPNNPLDINSSFELDVNVGLGINQQDSLHPKYPVLSFVLPFLLLSDEYFHDIYFLILMDFVPDELAGKIMFRDKNHEKAVNISLSVEAPEWCTVELENTTLTHDFLYVMNTGNVTSTKLKVKINEDAPALRTGEIKVNANFDAEENWIFASEENSTSFTVMPKYSGNITANIPAFEVEDELVIPQDVNTTIPLNITNNFNGETKVSIDYIDNVSSLNWTISLDQDEIIIPKGETKTVNIIVNSSSSKDLQTIQQTFTLNPMSTVDANVSDLYLYGDSIEISTGSIIKEKIEEEDTFEIDTTTLAVILLLIIIVTIVILIFIKRK